MVYTDGCFSKLEMRIHNGATVLIGVGIGIAFVEASKLYRGLSYEIFRFACIIKLCRSSAGHHVGIGFNWFR